VNSINRFVVCDVQALKDSCEDIDTVKPAMRHEGTQTLVFSLIHVVYHLILLSIGHFPVFYSVELMIRISLQENH